MKLAPRLLKGFVAAAMLALSTHAGATVISGAHTTAGGKVVDLSGLEWLSWNETFGVSRDAIEAGHGGLLADGWRYATGSEFTALISSLWGGVKLSARNTKAGTMFTHQSGRGCPQSQSRLSWPK
jgi:hypothetical protein